MKNVSMTRRKGLCVSCEICKAVCPEKSIQMIFEKGLFQPLVDSRKCSDCGICILLCPGADYGFFGSRSGKQANELIDIDRSPKCYTAMIKDYEALKNSSSGGLATGLICELLKINEFDKAFVLDYDFFNGYPARLKKMDDIGKIHRAAKSKYIPASFYDVAKHIMSERDERLIIVGTPCCLRAIRKMMPVYNCEKDKHLFLGLFCEMTLNYNVYRYFQETHVKKRGEIEKLFFRSKENGGWPGDVKIELKDGGRKFVGREKRIEIKEFFMLKRCAICSDKFNRCADISLGDCYIGNKQSKYGKSNVIINTEHGNKYFDLCRGLFYLEEESFEAILNSQEKKTVEKRMGYCELQIMEDICKETEVKDFKKTRKEFEGIIKILNMGAAYDKASIENLKRKRRVYAKARKAFKKATNGISVIGALAIEILQSELANRMKGRNREKNGEKKVLIVGGNFQNKGAQAMVFTAVDILKRKIDNADIYVAIEDDFQEQETEKHKYNFSICSWSPWKELLMNNAFYIFRRSKGIDEAERKLIRETDLIIDISGFALSSQWGIKASVLYLLKIIMAGKYGIDYIILPQSIGPFHYKGIIGNAVKILIRYCLKYPKEVYIREEQGIESVKALTKREVKKSRDIVLEHKDYKLENIYKNPNREFDIVKPEKKAVLIVPSERVEERIGTTECLSIYEDIIGIIRKRGHAVYIARHSSEDFDISLEIKEMLKHDKEVVLVYEEMDAIEIRSFISGFEYIVSSRYHAIVHAYKEGVPAVAIGWAVKYGELMKDYSQEQYCFDIRKGEIKEELLRAVERMSLNYERERKRIELRNEDIVLTEEEEIIKYKMIK